MEIISLSQIVTSLLAPALPYLMKGTEKAAEEAGAKLGEEAWSIAKIIWAKLSPKVLERPALEAAAKDAANSPSDDDSHEILRLQIKKLLSEDKNASLNENLSKFIENINIQRVLAEDGIIKNVLQVEYGTGKGKQEVIAMSKGIIDGVKQIQKF
jgi:hypothetical protein